MEQFNAVLIGAGTMGNVHLQSALDSPYIKELFCAIILQKSSKPAVRSITAAAYLWNRHWQMNQ